MRYLYRDTTNGKSIAANVCAISAGSIIVATGVAPIWAAIGALGTGITASYCLSNSDEEVENFVTDDVRQSIMSRTRNALWQQFVTVNADQVVPNVRKESETHIRMCNKQLMLALIPTFIETRQIVNPNTGVAARVLTDLGVV